MIEIIDGRGTGKSKQLLEAAQKNRGIILTQDKRAFKVKAKNYGYSDVHIYDYEDLENDTFPLGVPVFIHNGDKLLSWLCNKYYNIEVMGFTATIERKDNE